MNTFGAATMWPVIGGLVVGGLPAWGLQRIYFRWVRRRMGR